MVIDLVKAWHLAVEYAKEQAELSGKPYDHKVALKRYFQYTRP